MAAEKRTEAEWREVIAKQAASGQTQMLWCEENGINYATFIKRVLIIRKKDGVSGKDAPHKRGWVEIGPARTANHETGGLQVEIGAFKVTVPEIFEEASFKRVCKALSEIC